MTEDVNGDKSWYLNGKLHRTDGPAVECVCGTKLWYLNGEFHREDGPACEYTNGDKLWYLNGKLHRKDGPAIEWGYYSPNFYYLNGKKLSEEEWKLK